MRKVLLSSVAALMLGIAVVALFGFFPAVAMNPAHHGDQVLTSNQVTHVDGTGIIDQGESQTTATYSLNFRGSFSDDVAGALDLSYVNTEAANAPATALINRSATQTDTTGTVGHLIGSSSNVAQATIVTVLISALSILGLSIIVALTGWTTTRRRRAQRFIQVSMVTLFGRRDAAHNFNRATHAMFVFDPKTT